MKEHKSCLRKANTLRPSRPAKVSSRCWFTQLSNTVFRRHLDCTSTLQDSPASETCRTLFQPMFKTDCPVCEGKGGSSIQIEVNEGDCTQSVSRRLLQGYHEALESIGPMRTRCQRIRKAIDGLVGKLDACLSKWENTNLACENSAKIRRKTISVFQRWKALSNSWWYECATPTRCCVSDRKHEKQPLMDATKIPEVFDNARYDLLHSQTSLLAANAVEEVQDIFTGIEKLGPFVFALEFGITPDEKVEIGSKTVPKLIKKIADDLIFQHKRSLEFEQQKKQTENAAIAGPELFSRQHSNWHRAGVFEAHVPSRSRNSKLTSPGEQSAGDETTLSNSTERRPFFPIGGKTPSDQSLDDPCGLPAPTTGGQLMPPSTQSTMRSSDDEMLEDGEHIRLKQEEAKRMGIKSPWRKVRSRYYAASASHVTSLLNVLTYAESAIANKKIRRTLSRGQTINAADDDERTLMRKSSDSSIPKVFSATASPERRCVTSPKTIDPNLMTATVLGQIVTTAAKPCPPLYISATDTPYLSHLVIRYV
eukprot:Gregarina_sp_Poly_1__4258@NODE_231_length_11106_cov_68_912130_g204_i0_p3_GENE_NODE_231_length_11106_cov_68_912130_g204_i0NODE_231_length_11106_cov_68_912130_g204_i0_p3_ORF_typecomplete_len536_score79_12His_Phos_2/PF00328_22/5_9e17_NODE_231_length_11106_cov_68_912130_g204_i045176124